ncbi:MAG: hypothetical protein FWE91_09115 [Defluviitaleaceae bacterium]|nr:hypothetical protein [Defluviitaleaceae bacterium]
MFVRFFENSNEIEAKVDGGEAVKFWEYDEYAIIVQDRPDLAADIEENYDKWILTAKTHKPEAIAAAEISDLTSVVTTIMGGAGGRGEALEFRATIEKIAQFAPEDVAITAPTLFPLWSESWRGNAGTIVRDNGELYRSIHNVTNAGQNTKPSATPSMWTRIADPAEEFPQWIQPLGGHDAYPAGAKVTHNGKRWENIHGNGNIWEPSVFGWREITV